MTEANYAEKCLIWGTPARYRESENRDGVALESPRAGGAYFMAGTASSMLHHHRECSVRAKLTTWLIDQRSLGEECPSITSDTINLILQGRSLSVHERADRLMKFLCMLSPVVGTAMPIPFVPVNFGGAQSPMALARPDVDLLETTWGMLAASECLTPVLDSTSTELGFLIDYIGPEGRGWIRWVNRPDSGSKRAVIVTAEGYAHVAELQEKRSNSSQAFVAMWFDARMDDVFERGIAPAIRDAGYEPIRIDRKDHNNKIDDEIIAEIRRSRFLIADFTADYNLVDVSPKDVHRIGARGGVYYEAGFAHGLNIPVIFTCRSDVLDKLHFDTRQYNHIGWAEDKLTDFREAISNRISATIGDGPLKK